MDGPLVTDGQENADEEGDGRAVASRPSALEDARRFRDSFDDAEQARIEDAVGDLLDTLGKKHAMAVLRAFAFADGPLRYSDLDAVIEASPSTLSARLRELTATALLERTTYDEVPPRVEYEPTARAEALFPVFGHLHRWAVEFTPQVDDPTGDGDGRRQD